MPCYHPLTGYKAITLNPSGKRSIVFNAKEGYRDKRLELPCGQCIGCRLERSRQWAIRCLHESQMHEENSFITLTYADAPKGLVKSHFQDFMKRLRSHIEPRKVRYFHCGEYGENLGRPHYHACLFGFDFPDKKYWKSVNGEKYYTSTFLEDVWQHGFCTIGAVTFESAAYVARYISKKVTGPGANAHYGSDRIPEYVTMSRRPGIGKTWLEKFKRDVFPSDSTIIKRGDFNVEVRPPKFYLSELEKESVRAYERIRAKRQVEARKHKAENSPDRLKVKKAIKEMAIKQLKRSYEK